MVMWRTCRMWIPQSQPPGSLWIFLSTHPSKRTPSSPTTLPSVCPPLTPSASVTLSVPVSASASASAPGLCLSLALPLSVSICVLGRMRGRRCCRHVVTRILLLHTSYALAHIFLTQRHASKVCVGLRVQVLWCVCFGVERGSSRFFTASPLLDGPVNLFIQIQIYTHTHLVYTDTRAQVTYHHRCTFSSGLVVTRVIGARVAPCAYPQSCVEYNCHRAPVYCNRLTVCRYFT